MRETDLDLEESVFVWSSLAVVDDGVRDDDPLGSCMVLSLGLAVKLRRLSERRLYFEAKFVTLELGVVDEVDEAACVVDCNPKPANLNELSVTSCDC